MKNFNWVRKSALAMICAVTALTIIGYFIDPELVTYVSEDPDLYNKQRSFAMLTAGVGMFVGALFDKK